MKIFFIIDSLGKGGRERRCLQLVKGLNDLKINNIHIILFDNLIEYPEVYQLDVQLHVLNRTKPKEIKVYHKIKKLILTENPDVVFTWSIMATFWVSLIRLTNRFNLISGYVTDSISPKLFSINNFTRLLSFCTSKKIVGNSVAGLDAYKIPYKKRKLIYNGFDFNRLNNIADPEAIRNMYNIKTEYIVTMVANVSKYKDYDTYIECARKMISYRNDITFLAVGGGEKIDFYRSKLNSIENKHIIFTGKVDNVESIINATDICVLTSYSEGVSNFIIESMILGKPVIATNSGGTKEIIKDSETGFLINLRDKQDLIFKIELLLKDSEFKRLIGENAKKIGFVNFDLNKMCHKYLELFSNEIFKN